jgi:putative nucleotide binding protein
LKNIGLKINYLNTLVGGKFLYREQKKYEEYAYILDFLPHGRPGISRTSHSASGVIQMLGESYFTILEATPKRNVNYNIRDRIFVGKGDRALVNHILGRIRHDELTSSAKVELPQVIEIIVADNEWRFINFINNSHPLTPRMHSLELIPGIGKRIMFQILDLRERKLFESFEDLKNRVNLTDPIKLISRRIHSELSEEQKYYIFTRPI